MLRKCRRLPPAGLLRGSAAPRGRGACGKSTDSDSVPDEQRLKPMEELHGPSLLTNLNWLFLKRYFTIPHELQIEHSKIYGPLWKSKYGPLVVVNVARVDLIEQVLKQEGKYPIRTDMPHWRRYRELRNKAHGPLTEMGENWQRMRSILNPRLLKLDHMTSYGNTINEVVTDFIQRLAWLRDTNGQGVMVHNVTGELYKFAFEGICSVLFEARMGSLDAVMPEETQKFIFSVGEMFHLSQVVIFFPQSWWPWMSSWKRFEAAWDQIFKVGEDLVKKKMDALEKRADVNLDTEGAYLTHLLLSGKMTVPEILGSISELLLAGVDTTSNTVSWALYLLAKHPEIQQQLYQEVIDVCPGDKIPDSSDVSQMQFLKAVIKETLRMYPVVPGNARLIKEHEAVVGGYLFPKDTLFHLCHYATSYDEELFPNPRTFLPRRWLRVDGEMPKRNPFGSLPFGFSVRACLGRRIAELEMNLLLSRLIKQFEVRPDPAGVVVKPITRTLLCPGSAIDLQFVDRLAQ